MLWAYGMDGGGSDAEAEGNIGILSRLLRRVRNVRATNSLVDAAYTADGRLGGMLNQSTRIWDIAAPMLIVQEAGGCYTDIRGQALQLDISSGLGQLPGRFAGTQKVRVRPRDHGSPRDEVSLGKRLIPDAP
ncbi:MAG: hypothetical protein IH616_09525 [Gemmatimonadales bacterium]|nr:hypothetical protein [Gemmatimonadales bacterium]